jgi:N-acetylmuramoyl-L-alanine amidase
MRAMKKKLSPNHDSRNGRKVKALLVHYTGMVSAEAALERLSDSESRVSAHYIIDEAGGIVQFVEEHRRAWHAGESFWRGETDLNAVSIGIELVNRGHAGGLPPYPEAQMQSLIDLSVELCARHPIDPLWVLGHSDIAPDRKQDPGELFDWQRLSRHGIGLFPESPYTAERSCKAQELHNILTDIGYDPSAKMRIAAFQRRFRPRHVDNQPDGETLAIAKLLLPYYTKKS